MVLARREAPRTTRPRRAAIYVRISNDPHGDRLGVARQEKDCRALAKSKGWIVGGIYEDNDESAADIRNKRPEYQRLLRDIESGSVDGVLVYHLSRLHRRPAELETFMTLAESKGLPLASVAGDVDLASSQGRLVARLMGSVDAHESEVKGERIRRKHLELAQRGVAVGAGYRRPFGYSQDLLSIVPAEAKLLREAAKRILAGDTVYAIASEWNAKGHKTSTGGQWRTSVLRKVLGSARLTGRREYLGQMYKAAWPAILPVVTGERLRAALFSPTRRTPRSNRSLLAGIAVCGSCGEMLSAHRRGDDGTKHTRLYICGSGPGRPNCGKLSVLAAPLEAVVAEMVWLAMDRPKLAASFARNRKQDTADKVVDEIRADEGQLAQLAEMWAAKKFSAAEWLSARAPIEARLTDARARLGAREKGAAIADFVGRPGAVEKMWTSLTADRKRAIISTFLDKIIVKSAKPGANKFDPKRVEPVWRI